MVLVVKRLGNVPLLYNGQLSLYFFLNPAPAWRSFLATAPLRPGTKNVLDSLKSRPIYVDMQLSPPNIFSLSVPVSVRNDSQHLLSL